MSILSSSPFTVEDPEYISLSLKQRGLDNDLNMSLAGDGLTTRGEAYRNAPVRDLLEFSERSSVRVTKERALEVVGGPLSRALKSGAFATDVMPGLKVMDVEEFEARLDSLRDDCLSYAPRLFVEDGAVGSTRASELRVRVITDSPTVALYFRALLQRTPLYNPQGFPRTLTVYAGTLASEGIAAGRGMSAPFTAIDVDGGAARGTVAAVGPAALGAVRDAVAAAAGALQGAGGYRHKLGGSHVPAIRAAQEEGVIDWYYRDGHVYAPPGEAHPELLPLRGTVVAEAAGGGAALVVDGGGGAGAGAGVAGAALRAGRLFAAHHCVWEGAGGGLAAQWGGAAVSAGGGKGKGGPALVRGALVAQGAVATPLAAAARAAPPPARIIIVGEKGVTLAAAAGLGDKAKARAEAMLAKFNPKVEHVASEEEAVKALGL